MTSKMPVLLIPVEIQVRELDAKLLLACERIIAVLERTAADLPKLPGPPIGDRLQGWFKATKRRVRRWSKLRRTDPTRSLETSKTSIPKSPWMGCA